MSDLPAFIIHLRRATGRTDNVAQLGRDLPGAEVIDAVDGQSAHLPEAQPGTLLRPRYPFGMTRAEIACFLSHRAAWQRIIDEDLPGALVAEDDLRLGPGWDEARALLEAQATPESLIRLPAKSREAGPTLAERGAARLFLPRVIGLQMVLLWVGRAAAQRLLAASERFDRPVDTFVQMHWAHGQPVHALYPNGVAELTQALGGSTIQTKQRGGTVGREWRRFTYRFPVALRPQIGH